MPAAVHFTTPCGFEVWLIHLPATNTLRVRAFFGGEEVTLNQLNDKLSPGGALLLRDNLNKLYGGKP